MNQILFTNDNLIYNDISEISNIYNKNIKKYTSIFFFSITCSILLLLYSLFSSFSIATENSKTNILKNKYIISSLYQEDANYTTVKLLNNISVIGLIEIPKINISYPIIENVNKDLLKISVCRFSGPLPNRIGNLCIAGHNYKNNLMFSKLHLLNIGESIYIEDLNNTKLEYIIYNKFIVDENNLDCMQNTNNIEITLITCNNRNNNERLVIKAKMKG